MVEAITTEVPNLSSAIDVLSSMITPAILILAAASILNTVSARLIRVMDRVRELGTEIQDLAESRTRGGDSSHERRELLFLLLRSATRRARLLQKAMARLYAAIGTLVVTSIIIGVLSLSDFDMSWIALGIGFLAALMLLSASVLLIIESRMAMTSTGHETKFVWQWAGRHFSMVDIEAAEEGEI